MVRFVDYQTDYTGGVVLFKQPIPAADADGNPVFIMVTFEAASAPEQRLVAGAPAALDVRQLGGDGLHLDSMRIGVTAGSAEQAINPYPLIGGDVRVFRPRARDIRGGIPHSPPGGFPGRPAPRN